MRLVRTLGVALLVGFLLSMRAPLPGVFGPATAPVPPDELWTLNPE